jgi:hypothetical protein
VLLRTWNVSFPILCYLCYRGLGRLVVLYFVIDVIEDLEGLVSYALLSVLLRTWNVSFLILCYRCYRVLGGLVVLYFVINVIEDLEG